MDIIISIEKFSVQSSDKISTDFDETFFFCRDFLSFQMINYLFCLRFYLSLFFYLDLDVATIRRFQQLHGKLEEFNTHMETFLKRI